MLLFFTFSLSFWNKLATVADQDINLGLTFVIDSLILYFWYHLLSLKYMTKYHMDPMCSRNCHIINNVPGYITWVTQHILSFIRARAKSKKVSQELIGKHSTLSESLTKWPLVRQSSTSTQGLKQMNFWEINLYLHVIESLIKPQWQPSWQYHKTKGLSRPTVLHL